MWYPKCDSGCFGGIWDIYKCYISLPKRPWVGTALSFFVGGVNPITFWTWRQDDFCWKKWKNLCFLRSNKLHIEQNWLNQQVCQRSMPRNGLKEQTFGYFLSRSDKARWGEKVEFLVFGKIGGLSCEGRLMCWCVGLWWWVGEMIFLWFLGGFGKPTIFLATKVPSEISFGGGLLGGDDLGRRLSEEGIFDETTETTVFFTWERPGIDELGWLFPSHLVDRKTRTGDWTEGRIGHLSEPVPFFMKPPFEKSWKTSFWKQLWVLIHPAP